MESDSLLVEIKARVARYSNFWPKIKFSKTFFFIPNESAFLFCPDDFLVFYMFATLFSTLTILLTISLN